MDDERSVDSLPRLQRVMTVSPCVTVLCSDKGVSDGGAIARYGTLGDGGYAVHFICVQLAETMEMKTRAVGGEIVGKMDFDKVTPPCFNHVAR